MTPREANADLLAEITALRDRVASLTSENTELQKQQTATSEILRVISASPTDVQPVLDAVAESAARLCRSYDCDIFRLEGDRLVLVARHGPIPGGAIGEFTLSVSRGTIGGRTVLERRAIHVADLQAEGGEFPDAMQNARAFGLRTMLSAPLIREGTALGVIQLRRTEVNPFTDRQAELLQTFAAQAVIAIENVRLFTELQDKNQALTRAHSQVTESLEQQTATSKILRVISRSPTNAQPVFDAIAQSAMRLCESTIGVISRYDGEFLHLAANSHHDSPDALKMVQQIFPAHPSRGMLHGRVVLEGAVVHLPDVFADSEFRHSIAVAFRARSALGVPMLLDGRVVGVIAVARVELRPFTDSDIALLQTFADQAVIAIENVRLFTELEEKNRALTQAHAQVSETLERQTATSEILRVIASSPTDLQPVLDAVAERAARLCGANDALIFSVDGDVRRVVAHFGSIPIAVAPEHRLGRGFASGRAILERRTIHFHDVLEEVAQTDYEPPDFQRDITFRTVLATPLLREDTVVGAITIRRTEVRPFTDTQVALLKTFADQAVIAIENVRLFKELQARTQQLTQSVEQLTALREVGHAVSSSLDLETVLNTIVARAVQLAGAHSGTIWEYNAAAEEFVLRITQNVEDPELRANPNARVRRGEGAVGRLAAGQRPVQIPDITHEGAYEGRLRESLVGAGTRALLAVPLLHENQLLGGLVISRRTPGEFPAEVVELLTSFATQSALALQNARLFLEIEDKSRQLEAASQHKSEFLANMSHELRTPLNAIIGFSEVLGDRMFGPLNEKQEEYLKDIHVSGTHLLSLINDILDLSKIEAGRMELELTEFDLPTAIENALMLVRERAGRRAIALRADIDGRLNQIQGDERKIRQVVLNLLSNAIKFTPEGGRIEVSAIPRDGSVEVSVSDTGIGIAPEDQEKVFEEFRQVGTAATKVEGTGLGLTLCRKFVELHGGKIWVKSEVGAGATFTFTIPVRHGA